MVKTKYVIIIDTNIIRNSASEEWDNPLSTIGIRAIFDFIKKHKLENEVILTIPEIVLEEILSQKIHSINKDLEYLENLYEKYKQRFGLEGVDMPKYKSFNFYSFFKDKCSNFMQKHNLDLLKIPDIKADEILKRCLQKKPPFQTETDKGFKDTVLWLSILHLSINNPDTRIILATEDKIFREVSLNQEIKLINNTGITIYQESNEIVSQLSSELEVDKRFKERIDNVKARVVNEKINFILNEITKDSKQKGYTIYDLYKRYEIESYEFNSIQFVDIQEKGEEYGIIANLSLHAKYKKDYIIPSEDGYTPQSYYSLRKVNVKVILNFDGKNDELKVLKITPEPPFGTSGLFYGDPFSSGRDFIEYRKINESFEYPGLLSKKLYNSNTSPKITWIKPERVSLKKNISKRLWDKKNN
ncbi:DUF4935 domain-containing protein [Candidatus Woesearchaeota archaeon]|nr:DUF4935 domain-containing protein [Candidatus Woesearchaeota archaeon]